MTQRAKTPTYFAFYLLFSPDSWRLLAGFVAAVLIVPHITPPDVATAGRIMLYVMVAAVGWAGTAAPARWITRSLKKWLLGDRQS